VVLQGFPVQVAFAGSFEVPPGEAESALVEGLDAGGRRSGGGEGGEQGGDGVLHGGVGVEDDVPGGVVDQPDGQWGDQFAAAGFGQHAAAQAGFDEMELCFRHLPCLAQQ
jgi:hypothetical protein